VENRTQLSYLRAQGCSEAQGYLFSRPVPATELSNLLEGSGFDVLLEPTGVAVPAA
jgi:EAL domain-containing protein (putative c-di-GMP-specific phosphodiesterase class I)